MEAKLREANLDCAIVVDEVQYTEPLSNGIRAVCGRIAKEPAIMVRVRLKGVYTLTLDGGESRIQILAEDAAGFYFLGSLK